MIKTCESSEELLAVIELQITYSGIKECSNTTLKSSVFKFYEENWRVEFAPNGYEVDGVSYSEGKTSYYIERIDYKNGGFKTGYVSDVKIKGETEILNHKIIVESAACAIENGDFQGGALCSFETLIDPTNGFYKDDTVILHVTLKLKKAASTSNGSDIFLKGVSELLESETYSDMTLVVENVKIPCHKMILCLKSPVFKAMFDNQMQESVTNEIVISDFSEEVMRSMLRCLYQSASVQEEVGKFGEQLYLIAHKYELTTVLSVVQSCLIAEIDSNNAVDKVLFADKYDIVDMKNKAIKVISQSKSILTNPQLSQIVGHELCSEIFAEMATKLN